MVLKRRSIDRRRQQRIPIDAKIGIGLVRWSPCAMLIRPQFYGMLRDASVNGLLCTVDRTIKPASVVKLWLDVELEHHARRLCLSGTVAWNRPDPTTNGFLVGIHLNAAPSVAGKAWIKVMVDELRLHEGTCTAFE